MPNNDVFNYIKNKSAGPSLLSDEDDVLDDEATPYSSIIRAGAAEPVDIIPGASQSPGRMPAQGAQDPMMQRYEQDQAQAQQRHSESSDRQRNANIIQALSVAANGVNDPKPMDSVYKNIGDLNTADDKFATDQVSNRQKVFDTIAKRNATASQNALVNELKQQRLGLDSDRLGLDKTKSDAATRSRDSQIDAYKQRTNVLGATAGNRMDNSNIRTADKLLGAPNLNKEVTKLNTARSAQSLMDAIRSGDLKDSKNVAKQLTNMIATIEMGSPGGVGDREAMGVNTLYTKVQDQLAYLSGNPQSSIPAEYLDQLEHEIQALGNRAAKNFKTTSDAALQGADLSGGVPGADKGKAHGLAQQRRDELLRANGFDPATAEPVQKQRAGKAKPQTVIQNGHTYTLNPATGEYE